jgi:outer membrane biogenesis lipoprotein LolB
MKMSKILAVVALILTTAGAFAFEVPPSCPGDTVVWVNTKSNIYHYNSTTKQGAFACEKDALAKGARASKTN